MPQQNTFSAADKATVASDLERLCVKKGDRVFLHSAFKSLGIASGNPQEVIDAYKKRLIMKEQREGGKMKTPRKGFYGGIAVDDASFGELQP